MNNCPDPGSDNPNDMFFQVIASVLRNLSWRADVNSKKTLREVGSVRALTGCALVVQKVNEEFLFSQFSPEFALNSASFAVMCRSPR